MPRRQSPRSDALRQRLAQEAAQILAEEGVRDYLVAKRKAATRLGIARGPQNRVFPTNVEIEAALEEYHRLFCFDSQPDRLRQLREAAVEAMRLLEPFRPRLVGPVLAGNAPTHAGVQLHLFADTPEQLVLFLMERDIPFESGEKRYRLGSGEHRDFPAYSFVAGDIVVEMAVFPPGQMGQAPKSPVDGRPMQRGTLREVEGLLEECPQL